MLLNLNLRQILHILLSSITLILILTKLILLVRYLLIILFILLFFLLFFVVKHRGFPHRLDLLMLNQHLYDRILTSNHQIWAEFPNICKGFMRVHCQLINTVEIAILKYTHRLCNLLIFKKCFKSPCFLLLSPILLLFNCTNERQMKYHDRFQLPRSMCSCYRLQFIRVIPTLTSKNNVVCSN